MKGPLLYDAAVSFIVQLKRQPRTLKSAEDISNFQCNTVKCSLPHFALFTLLSVRHCLIPQYISYVSQSKAR